MHLRAFYLVSCHQSLMIPLVTSCYRGFRPIAAVLDPKTSDYRPWLE